ncbi:MAG: glycosyltransferase family 2 protein [Epulopiscium sp.]|jgi:GT2 family glycosyltransferase|nr:glycosyltransferase family 2 protein [Candidatus Epulonipiscium sp.]
MNNINISFVILHYQSIKTTIECIEYVRQLPSDVLKNIVIVDNASPNKSGEELKELYKNEKNVYVLVNKINEGFARGNNLGYKFSKEQLKSDIVIVMNNDVMIKQPNFISLLLHEAFKNEVYIIAPDIITPSGNHQNPYRVTSIETKEILYILLLNNFNKLAYSIPGLSKLILHVNNTRPRIRKTSKTKWENELDEIIPHGSCVVYTKKWVDNEDFAFLPKTFMYLEEYLLDEYIRKKRYKTKYIPRLKVHHLEDISTNSVNITSIAKAKFKAKHAAKSTKELLMMRIFVK